MHGIFLLVVAFVCVCFHFVNQSMIKLAGVQWRKLEKPVVNYFTAVCKVNEFQLKRAVRLANQ